MSKPQVPSMVFYEDDSVQVACNARRKTRIEIRERGVIQGYITVWDDDVVWLCTDLWPVAAMVIVTKAFPSAVPVADRGGVTSLWLHNCSIDLSDEDRMMIRLALS